MVERGVWIENFNYETLTPGTGELEQEQWSRIEWDYVALKEAQVFVSSGKKKGSVRTETNAVFGMRVTIVRKTQNTKPPHLPSHRFHEVEVCRRKEVSKAKVTVVPFFDDSADTNWKVLARDHLVNIGILPSVNQFYKTETGCKAGDKCSFPHHKVDEQPNKKPKKGYSSHKRKRRQECCGYGENCTTLGLRLARFGSIGFSKEKRPRGNPMQKVLGSSRKGRFTQSTLRKASVPENIEPSLGKIHQRYEIWGPVTWRDRENSDVPEAKHGTLPKKTFTKLKEKVKAKFCSHAEEWVLPNASSKEPKEREFVVDSGASMHMVSKRDLYSAELETMKTSRSPTTVMTANGEVQTREEATVNVKELDLFVTVMFLEETPAVPSHGKLCEDHGYTYHWTSGQKPHLTKNGTRIDCKNSNCVPFEVPGSSTSSSTTPTPHFFIIFITRFCIWRHQVHRKSSTRKKWKYEWGVTEKPDA